MQQDLYTVLESLGWLFRISGIYPFTLNDSGESRKYALNTISVTFSIVFFIVSAKYFYEYSIIIKNVYDAEEESLAVLMISVRQITSLICIFDASIMKIIYSRRFMLAINNLALQDQILKIMGYSLNYKLMFRISVLSIPCYLLVSNTLLNSEFLVVSSVDIPTAFRVFGNFSILVQMTNTILFVFLIINVGQRFKGLNFCILKLVNHEYTKLGMPISNKTPAEYMQMAAQVHARLCEIGKAINSVFYITLIVTTIGAFIFSTTMIFYIFTLAKYGFQNVGFSPVFLFFALLFIQIFTVLKIVLSCNWTSRQAAITSKILHSLSLSDMCVDDDSLSEMVRTFSMQILHHNFSFTAAGFFQIDSTLIQSFAGAVTTYLVILIQFDPKIA
ncbi:gustatory receptor 5 isoform X1 [Nasonia vitripennis]|uniref:Gustatory receptor n=2 Tax=Nasonia vitripennis TaxID=7425 RepID=A0A7M6UM30_NASVI|nr:gustatory receptor 5 [Nasonia vitripennis]XP_031786743.1 gustatory receptor 5 isoform X1 [Nasonia vitripennis]